MADRDISPGHSYDDKADHHYDDKTGSHGGAEMMEHAGQGRRGSTAVNIVENPLQVRLITHQQHVTH